MRVWACMRAVISPSASNDPTRWSSVGCVPEMNSNMTDLRGSVLPGSTVETIQRPPLVGMTAGALIAPAARSDVIHCNSDITASWLW